MLIREERSEDQLAIARVVAEAFGASPHGDHGEAWIVAKLRDAGALFVSLVAETQGQIVGYVAFSPVTIDGASCGWFGLGPVAVLPAWQASGTGRALIEEGLARLRSDGANGCVVLGDPGYYGRFRFRSENRLTYDGHSSPYFQSLAFADSLVSGDVRYHAAFEPS